jgi:5-methyltetrahydrofolate--homocysteine methyltransferase
VVLSGQIASDRIFEAFAEQAEALQWGGVDGLVLETFQELDEMRLAVRACRHATDLPLVGCMSFQTMQGRYYTQLGVKPEALASAAARIGLDAVGLNCGTGLDDAVAIAAVLLDNTDLPVWVKSNAGLPEAGPDRQLRYPCGYRQFAEYAGTLAEMGVPFIGGCCGTDPACIEAIRASVDGYLAESGSKN